MLGNTQNFAQNFVRNPHPDAAITTNDLIHVDFPDYVLPGKYTVSGEFIDIKQDMKDAVLAYTVDGGNKLTQALHFRSAGNSFRIENMANLTAGNHLIKVWVDQLNGTIQQNPQTLEYLVHVASRAIPRNGLIEQFTSSTCPPCASENATLDPLLKTNNPNTGGRVNVIRYQMNWPSPGNDPSYNPHAVSRRTYYSVSSIPNIFINGKSGSISSQTSINNSYSTDATVEISATINPNGNNIKCKATITPAVTVSGVKVHQAILQKYYKYSGASTSQKDYYYVMRKMNPDGNGATQNITSGTPFDVTFDLTANVVTQPTQNSYDFWQTTTVEYQYVVFVQDANKNVLNSSSGVLSTSGIVHLEGNAKIGVYPNPSDEYAIIALKQDKAAVADLHIYDLNGKLVYSKKSGELSEGQNEITISTKNFPAGVYNIVITTGTGSFTEKLTVTH